MDCLFKYSLDNKLPIDLIYMNNSGEISYRSVIIRKILVDGILTFDLSKQEIRSFKRENILSAVKQQRKRGIYYA